MLRKTARRLQWMGGTHKMAVMGPRLPENDGMYIGMQRAVRSQASIDRDNLTGPVQHWTWENGNREFRADIYDEIAKLPLRFTLHPYDRIHEAMSRSAVGYAPPLGPADPEDTIPFHIHRMPDGTFPHTTRSINPQKGDPRMILSIWGVDGDVFRFEDEMIKILPSFKTFVRDDAVQVWDTTHDVTEILEHWYIALGF
uniref:Uncharacterized protein n=1 Tax=Neobodo designis TaxID=312471 RepID=A0A7S1QHB7_NEODS|mmetsp:Transcript_46665/g.143909  ORF Transcript_46665/g.143909 Transcript_46665/m.143909 type:complete len:198 (+) Transcript_46665:103-696(+)